MNLTLKSSTGHPVVMVSYSHESNRHKNRVLKVADRLRKEAGCKSILDRYDEVNVANWPQWMRRQIRQADYVLMVFTHTYRRRFDGEETKGRGMGVTWEGAIITNALYAAAANDIATLKFIPCVLAEKDLAHVPRDVFSGTTFVLDRDWNRLVHRLWKKPSVQPPPIGGRPSLLEEERSNKNNAAIRVRVSPSVHLAPPPLKVLFVGAQKGTGLDLRGQLRMTKAAIARAKFGQSVRIDAVYNITPDKMLMELNRRSPTVLHLSGKQEHGQVKMHNERGKLTPVSADQLSRILGQYQHMLRLVILDTCDSLPQAKKIVQTVDCAIGVASGIAEPVAIEFFAMFYNALASGASAKRAYNLAFGLQQAKIEGNRKYQHDIEEILDEKFNNRQHLPRLVWRKGLKPDKIYLVPLISPTKTRNTRR